MATSMNAIPATPPRTPPRRLGLTGGLLSEGVVVDVGTVDAEVLLVGATYPPPPPPSAMSVPDPSKDVASDSEEVVEVAVLFRLPDETENVDVRVELLPVLEEELNSCVLVEYVYTTTVPSTVTVDALGCDEVRVVEPVDLVLPTKIVLEPPQSTRAYAMSH